MISIVTWKWGGKYQPNHVKALRNGVRRHIDPAARFVCVTDDARELDGIETIPIPEISRPLLAERDGCYARLAMFSPIWRAAHGLETIVCLDLDLILVGKCAGLFARPEPFMILHGGHYNPCPFNGSVMKIGPGAPAALWDDFRLDEARAIAFADGKDRGTDQTWIAAKAPTTPGWTWRDGIFAMGKPGWPGGEKGSNANLPLSARIVCFPGHRDPSRMLYVPWINSHWRP